MVEQQQESSKNNSAAARKYRKENVPWQQKKVPQRQCTARNVPADSKMVPQINCNSIYSSMIVISVLPLMIAVSVLGGLPPCFTRLKLTSYSTTVTLIFLPLLSRVISDWMEKQLKRKICERPHLFATHSIPAHAKRFCPP